MTSDPKRMQEEADRRLAEQLHVQEVERKRQLMVAAQLARQQEHPEEMDMMHPRAAPGAPPEFPPPPLEGGSLIGPSQAAYLAALPLADAERILQTNYREARNEMCLVYEDTGRHAVGCDFGKDARGYPTAGSSVDFVPALLQADPERRHADCAPEDAKPNLTVTHNHPHAAPLSIGDVTEASKANLKQIRAVGRHGVFSIERPERGWPPSDRVYGDITDCQDEERAKMMAQGVNEKYFSDNFPDATETQLHRWHVMEAYAKKIGTGLTFQDSHPDHPWKKELEDSFKPAHAPSTSSAPLDRKAAKMEAMKARQRMLDEMERRSSSSKAKPTKTKGTPSMDI